MTRLEAIIKKIAKTKVYDESWCLTLSLCNAYTPFGGCEVCPIAFKCKEEKLDSLAVERWLHEEDENGVTNYEKIFPDMIKYLMENGNEPLRVVLCNNGVECDDCPMVGWCSELEMTDEEFKAVVEEEIDDDEQI